MVTSTPKKNVIVKTKKKFFFLIKEPPMMSPISVMDSSVPPLNNAMPTMIIAQLMPNKIMS